MPFDNDTLAIRDVARQVLSDTWTPEIVRATWDEAAGTDRRRWQALAEVGLQSLAVPAAYGGMELGPGAIALVLEESGYFAVPEPFVETVVAAQVIAAAGSDTDRGRWLPQVADGTAMFSVAMPNGLASYAVTADAVLVRYDDTVSIVAGGPSDWEPVRSMDSGRRPARRTDGAIGGSDLRGDTNAAEVLRNVGAAAAAAYLTGLGRRLVDETVEYAAAREQFGRPIGSFQAVKHLIADAALAVEVARPSAWAAIGAFPGGGFCAAVAASVAKAVAGRAAALASDAALQVHAGIGFTWEHDLHFWLKRVRALEPMFGASGTHEAFLGMAAVDNLDRFIDVFGPQIIDVERSAS